MLRISFVLLCCISTLGSFACTTFCLQHNGQLLFGRNYDWVTGAGIVYSNQRGLTKTSSVNKDGETITWTSKYGSLTFNQYGKEFPTGGMNEKGLVVELMWLDETSYPEKDSRASINVLQWLQYQLDNATSIDEVINSDERIRIASGSSPLHYLIADASGKTATIEFLNGKMVVHKSSALPYQVLTNSTYKESKEAANAHFKMHNEFTLGNNSLDRFVKACTMIRDVQKNKGSLTDYSFEILRKVSQGDYTKWSIVYDITNKKIHFKTNRFKDVKTIDMKEFDFSCTTSSLMFNMNQAGKGDITSRFIKHDNALKKSIASEVTRDSRSNVDISDEDEKEMLEYEKTVKCGSR